MLQTENSGGADRKGDRRVVYNDGVSDYLRIATVVGGGGGDRVVNISCCGGCSGNHTALIGEAVIVVIVEGDHDLAVGAGDFNRSDGGTETDFLLGVGGVQLDCVVDGKSTRDGFVRVGAVGRAGGIVGVTECAVLGRGAGDSGFALRYSCRSVVLPSEGAGSVLHSKTDVGEGFAETFGLGGVACHSQFHGVVHGDGTGEGSTRTAAAIAHESVSGFYGIMESANLFRISVDAFIGSEGQTGGKVFNHNSIDSHSCRCIFNRNHDGIDCGTDANGEGCVSTNGEADRIIDFDGTFHNLVGEVTFIGALNGDREWVGADGGVLVSENFQGVCSCQCAETGCSRGDGGIFHGEGNGVAHILPAEDLGKVTRDSVFHGVFHSDGTGDGLGIACRSLVAGGSYRIVEDASRCGAPVETVGTVVYTGGKTFNGIACVLNGERQSLTCLKGGQTHGKGGVGGSCQNNGRIHRQFHGVGLGRACRGLVAGGGNENIIIASRSRSAADGVRAVEGYTIRKVGDFYGGVFNGDHGRSNICFVGTDRLFFVGDRQFHGVVHSHADTRAGSCRATSDGGCDSDGVFVCGEGRGDSLNIVLVAAAPQEAQIFIVAFVIVNRDLQISALAQADSIGLFNGYDNCGCVHVHHYGVVGGEGAVADGGGDFHIEFGGVGQCGDGVGDGGIAESGALVVGPSVGQCAAVHGSGSDAEVGVRRLFFTDGLIRHRGEGDARMVHIHDNGVISGEAAGHISIDVECCGHGQIDGGSVL